jgi:Amt family ammonium transporter
LVLGVVVAFPCYVMIVWRPRTRVDETLDVLAAHGVAGFSGILFLGLAAQAAWNDTADGLFYGGGELFGDQVLAALVAPAYAFVATFLILTGLKALGGLRATEAEEATGMDVIYHGEEAYVTGEGAILVTPEGDQKEPALVANPN